MRPRVKTVIIALSVVVGLWVLVTGGLWLAQRQLIYLPDRDPASPPADVAVQTVETTDGITHHAWVVPAEGEPVARLLVFNGNAGNKGHRLPLARSLARQSLEVVLFDYRGYGDTGGTPSEDGLLLDAEAVGEVAFDTDLPVVYFGESLGAGVATSMAIGRPPDALVLRSPFTSIPGMARAHYPFVPTFLLRDRFPIEDQIEGLDVPVLVVLGTSDTIVPPALSRRVFEAASEPKELVEMEGLNHNDADLGAGPGLAKAVRDFLETSGVVTDETAG